MNCLCSRHSEYVEVFCREADQVKFEALGFIRALYHKAGRPIRMVHATAPCSVVPELLELGKKGLSFTGYTNPFLPETPGLIAADGERSIVVLSNAMTREPITTVRQDGCLPTYDLAREYWDIWTAAKERMDDAQHN